MAVISNGTTLMDAGAISIAVGSMTLIKTLTASNSATLSFVDGASGVILDNTYKTYIFKFHEIHPSSNDAEFTVNFRDGGTAYDATKTTTAFRSYHFEGDDSGLGYQQSNDLAQSTAIQKIGQLQSANDNDSCGGGEMKLYNPSNTTYVKHFQSRYSHHYTNSSPGQIDNFISGYANVTAAVDGVQFKFDSGNISTGQIKLYGIGE
jgi:hypothetical protein